MGTNAKPVGLGVLLISLGVLPCCRHWRVTDAGSPHACPCAQRAVLADLGVGTDPTARPSGSPVGPGPSLVAGDAIAMNWGFAFGIAPRGHSASWVLVGLSAE